MFPAPTVRVISPVVTDPTGPSEPTAFEAWVDRLVSPWIVDPRDVIFTRNVARIVLTVLPASLAVFAAPGWWALLAGLIYVPWLMIRWTGPYVLMVHAVTHRPLFKKRYWLADRFVTMGLAPWFGIPPTAYHPHHVLAHHKENNGPDDISSTTAYQRDKFSHFLHYWVRFAFFGHLHLGSFLVRREHWRSLALFVLGEFLYAGAVAALFWLDPVSTFVVFVIPFLLLRFFLMAGNWAQHAFLDAENPTNSYTNSTVLLNTRYNRRCYNDGYHIVHHRKPGLHWADMPGAFLADLPRYLEHDAIVFDGVTNNQQIWWCLMRGDYGFLADRLVDLGERKRTREEKIAFLMRRVQTIGEARRGLLELREAST